MKGCLIYCLNHDIRNIIELMLHHYRVKNTNKEYRQVFYFFDNLRACTCPDPSGRCVGRWLDVTVHWLDGQLHRKNGPAIEQVNGSKAWCYKGKYHRLDGPAIEFANGTKKWYVKGQLHRLDGPAVEYANGDKYWYYKNQLHRLDGPAIEWANGTKEWWVDGTKKMAS